MSAERREDGFVLLEVIVAFLVLAVSLAAGMAAISQGALAIRRAGEAARAADLAREVAALRLAAPLAPGIAQGERDGAEWRLEARALPDGDEPPLLAVTIAVRPPGAARPYLFRSFATGAAPP